MYLASSHCVHTLHAHAGGADARIYYIFLHIFSKKCSDSSREHIHSYDLANSSLSAFLEIELGENSSWSQIQFKEMMRAYERWTHST